MKVETKEEFDAWMKELDGIQHPKAAAAAAPAAK